ncbi:acyl-CoA thioester hydrolase [Pseudobutyrivibrio sp. JW11]|uniref:acyl-CoA thioesterase n=1 Tax=Pseudobutyrivibrio sp. JW11 TaxID=1855302 RepID=UPI0008EA1385|nr:acyl-CoA thioesterase [Pseudobutyrivibrio sp. JW11]SFO49195.1 acyl-CoA thioester hydrolase [Pseudobutyrivibrio sp. JW11]
METSKYIHIVQYYETDKMGITHHSNYIRWMEEARVDFLNQIGWPFDKLETLGIVSPVLNVSCDYKLSTVFSEKIAIVVAVKEFKGVKLFLSYTMENEEGKVVCTGTTSHAFLNTQGRPIRMKQEYPEFYQCLMKMVEDQ